MHNLPAATAAKRAGAGQGDWRRSARSRERVGGDNVTSTGAASLTAAPTNLQNLFITACQSSDETSTPNGSESHLQRSSRLTRARTQAPQAPTRSPPCPPRLPLQS